MATRSDGLVDQDERTRLLGYFHALQGCILRKLSMTEVPSTVKVDNPRRLASAYLDIMSQP